MARFDRAFLLATALGAALAVPAVATPSATAANGGAAPVAALSASGGAAPDGPTGATGSRGTASSDRTGGAVPGRTPRRVKPPRRAVPQRRRTAARRAPTRRAAPAPETPAAPEASATVDGTFPVQGAYSFGGDGSRFGSGRPGHVHQGQDVAAASGTPIVAPVAGTVTWKANQPGGAGIYLVVRGAADGRDYVFMHLKSGSVLVAPDQAVAAGQALAQVGATGVASGPHLHFEIWVGGWQARGGAPIDPLPQLQRWAGGSS
jgi:murein DD-endopeptidase MepM/ murein hydrolase activator NlpD